MLKLIERYTMEFETCPVCGSENIEMQIESENFEYKGHLKKIDGCEKIVCKDCEEAFFTDETSKRNEKIIRDFHREIDGLLTSTEMVRIRKAFGFSQKAFGDLLGGGPKAFAKYESCVLTQSRAMDNLIRMIDGLPGAIEFLKDCEATKNVTFKKGPRIHLKSARPTGLSRPDYNVLPLTMQPQIAVDSCEEENDNLIAKGA